MGMSPGSVRRSANLVILFLFSIFALAAIVIVVGFLGPLLLAFALVTLFLIGLYLSGGGFRAWELIAGIFAFFFAGYFVQNFVLASTVNLATMYQSSIALSSVSLGISDATYSLILGFVVLLVVVALAVFGLFVSARKHR